MTNAETYKKFVFFIGLEKQLSTFIYQDLSAVLPPISAAGVIFDGEKLHGPLLALINKLQNMCAAANTVYFGLRFSSSDPINDENAASLGLQFLSFF